MRPTSLQLTALWFTGVVALLGMGTFCCCAIWKIYLDVPQLLVLSNVTVGAVSSFTTLLTGKTVAQLAQGTADNPLKAEVVNKDENPVPVETTHI